MVQNNNTRNCRKNYKPVWDLHVVQVQVCLVKFYIMVNAGITINTAMSHQVLRDPHLGGDVSCVSTGVIKVAIHVPVT